MVEVVDTISAVRAWTGGKRQAGRTVGLVPTMGALHRGHARLIEQARHEVASLVVSVFVNPLQFDRPDDLERYPRTLEADVRMCEELGVDLVFAPSSGEMYPAPPLCTVTVKRIADHLCGAFRPGHFDGVATVVTKLFQIVQPDVAYFGEKDAQQLAIIRRLVADLNMPLRVAGVPTVREADGLALSSRNTRLSAAERKRAPALYEALKEADRAIAAGERDARAVQRLAAAAVPYDAALRLEYLEVVDPVELQPLDRITGPALVAGAMWVGNTRLIDNLLCNPPPA
jgi:pantoate--beta-alanine ligase